ncbi:MAG: dienelactone hydrolase family protein [Bdellovibrionales bacterium]|nr:dienelactone hydrolase family protein [Bdellovibrionales bacterium]
MKTKITTIALTLMVSFFMNTTSMAAGVYEKIVEYKDGNNTYEGFLAMPKAATGGASKTHSVPGILVVHNWMGITDETKSKTRALAGLGYAAFAVDVYGKGVRPKNADEAGKLATQYRGGDRTEFRKRLNLGLNELAKTSGVNAKKLGAVGYCFGGTAVIELARSGAEVLGVASFHGGLDSPEPALGKNIKGKVIAFHGADDPFVQAKDLAAFEDEMRTNKIDWQLVKFGNAVHSFTEKAAGNDNSKGAAYNEKADERSWVMMKDFFKTIF